MARREGRFSMAGAQTDFMRMVRRNKLVGMWAAEKLSLPSENAKAYSDELAKGTFDIERNDILQIIRRDFDAAGVVQSDDQILAIMTESWLEAGGDAANSDASDAALVHIARTLMG
ncbi:MULTISPECIES: ATPase inhibitor subunit zeta [Rhizobium/Agrobacterium group]|uniref:ATPase inhibitor subunit zeta n=2 Tax=Rhizobium/Agrobacterium group TaxID=227290 RepID=UPI00247887D2|nr:MULTISPECIES: ATPase inhibitor subunit zeta [Rhizobium/Agrobacterium group]